MSAHTGPLLGIDLGTKRVGISLSDPEGRIALRYGVLDGTDESALLGRLAGIAEEESVCEFVIGHPKNMDGSHGEKAEWVEAFRVKLVARVSLPVHLWDERLTSVQAERTLLASRTGANGRIRKKKGPKSDVDQIAAVLILQSFLDRRASEAREDRT